MISNVRYAQEFNATFHGMFKSLHLDKVQEWKWEKICESCSILSVVLQDPYHCKILDYFDHKNPMLRCQLVISPSEKEVIFIKSLNLFWQLEINWWQSSLGSLKNIVYFVVVVGRSYPKLNLSRGLCEWIFARILRARIERTTYNATSQSRCSTNCNTNVYYPHFSLSNTFSLDSVLTAIPIRIMLQVYYISHWKGLEKNRLDHCHTF